jgi:hypothetical protein
VLFLLLEFLLIFGFESLSQQGLFLRRLSPALGSSRGFFMSTNPGLSSTRLFIQSDLGNKFPVRQYGQKNNVVFLVDWKKKSLGQLNINKIPICTNRILFFFTSKASLL